MSYWDSLSSGLNALRAHLPVIDRWYPSETRSESSNTSPYVNNNDLESKTREKNRISLASSLDLGNLPMKIEDTICLSCKKMLERPRLLSCGHRLCHSCCESLLDINAATSLNCPGEFCGAITYLDGRGVEGLLMEQSVVDFVEQCKKLEQAERESSSSSESLIDIAVSAEVISQKHKLANASADTFGFVLLDSGRAEMTASEAAEKINAYIPFSFAKATLMANTNTWMRTLYFAPSDFAQAVVFKEPEAYFVPFYVFDIVTKSMCTAQLPCTTTVDVASDDAEDASKLQPPAPQPIEINLTHIFSEVLTCASYYLNPNIMRSLLKPPNKESRLYPAASITPFNSESLLASGKLLSIDVEATDAWRSKEIALKHEVVPARCREDLLKTYPNAQDIDIVVDVMSSKHQMILLPFFHLCYSYNGADYEVLMSGWNGHIDGSRPYGWGTAGKIVNTIYGAVKETI